MISKFAHLACFLVLSGHMLRAQSPYYSESLIKYDLLTHKTDKPIPFDRSFTLVVEKFPAKNVTAAHLFEAEFVNNERGLVYNHFTSCYTNKDTVQAIYDVALRFKTTADTLQLYFPPLKPNKDFDVNIIFKLSQESLDALYTINGLLFTNDTAKARSKFQEIYNSLVDPFNQRTYFSVHYDDYRTFFNDSLKSLYQTIATSNLTSGSLTESEFKAIEIGSSTAVSEFKDAGLFMEVYRKRRMADIEKGLLPLTKIYAPDAATIEDGYARIKNLTANLLFADSLLNRVNRIQAKGIVKIKVEGTDIALSDAYTHVSQLKATLDTNLAVLKKQTENIDKKMLSNSRFRAAVYLVGNTVSSDLKTAGGNVLFLDAGLTNIMAEGVTEKTVSIPKLYYGVSIYFRPIDKNTRRNRFPKSFSPPENKGCVKDTAGNVTYGPDYGALSKWTIWQHLCLNIGVTFGDMVNKDYDNLYNKTSLLIGPAYRFARGFKVSAGTALLRRTSKNPLVSDKKVTAGGYVSASVDIDFIQGIKDVTSMLFK